MHFTKKALEALPVPSEGRAIHHDDATRGLVLKIEASGNRSFAWYRKIRGYPQWKSFGRFPDLSIEAARHRADELNAKLANWKAAGWEGPDPFERPAVTTLDAAVDEYVEKHLKDHAKRPEQAERTLRAVISRHCAPLRERKLASVQHEDVAVLHRRIGAKHGHHVANDVVGTLKTLFNFATRAKLFHGANPAQGHLLFHEDSRARFLQPDELPRLFDALVRAPNPDLKDFVLLSLWTGSRKHDLFSMRWQDVSFETNTWTVPNPKNRRPYSIPLLPEAVGILKERLTRAERDAQKTGIQSAYVFPSHGKSGHLEDLQKAWQRLLAAAGLDYSDQPELQLRIHDLRRSAGSYLAITGASLPIVGASLGHVSQAATSIYARLYDAPIRQAMAKSHEAMRTAMRSNVLALPAPKGRKAARRA